MKIHEYQAKEIFRRFGVPTPRGEMVTSAEDARKVAQKLGVPVVAVLVSWRLKFSGWGRALRALRDTTVNPRREVCGAERRVAPALRSEDSASRLTTD